MSLRPVMQAWRTVARLRGQAGAWRSTIERLRPLCDCVRIETLRQRVDWFERVAADLEAVEVEERIFEARARAAA